MIDPSQKGITVNVPDFDLIALQCLIMAIPGLVLFGLAVSDRLFFRNHPSLRPMTYLFGMEGSRKIYGTIGLTLMVFAAWVWLAKGP